MRRVAWGEIADAGSPAREADAAGDEPACERALDDAGVALGD